MAFRGRPFTVTYADGQTERYDETFGTVEEGVLKLGTTQGDWTHFISPSKWSTIEVHSDHPTVEVPEPI